MSAVPSDARPATFPKSERLCSKSAIASLMDGGRRGAKACLRFCCLKPGTGDGPRVLISVPKRYFKRAVKRNLLKRRIREAWRLNKSLLAADCPPFDILLTFGMNDVREYREIESALRSILEEVASW